MTEPQSPPVWPLESSNLIAEYEMFSVRHDRARDPAEGSVRDLHVTESPDGVVVIALTGEEEMILVEQFRHGIRSLSLEAPAGIVDEGEDPVVAGLRELREETGFVSERGRLLGTLSLNPSWQAVRVHVVLAQDAERRAEKELDDGESTRVCRLPLGRVLELVRRGEINSAVSLAALLLLQIDE